jgi:hypothetical protein
MVSGESRLSNAKRKVALFFNLREAVNSRLATFRCAIFFAMHLLALIGATFLLFIDVRSDIFVLFYGSIGAYLLVFTGNWALRALKKVPFGELVAALAIVAALLLLSMTRLPKVPTLDAFPADAAETKKLLYFGLFLVIEAIILGSILKTGIESDTLNETVDSTVIASRDKAPQQQMGFTLHVRSLRSWRTYRKKSAHSASIRKRRLGLRRCGP